MDSYAKLLQMTTAFKGDKTVIGKTVLGQDITAYHVGSYAGRQGIVQCGMHAREYVTCALGVRLAESFVTPPSGGGVWFVFAANPDGVRLALDGAGWITDKAKQDYLLKINKSKNFSLFKANANCVDLNTNFDAKWGFGGQNVNVPSAANYVGKRPMSEPETVALANFTKRVAPAFTISYHAKGNVIYYGFDTQTAAEQRRDGIIAKKLSAVTGYPAVKPHASTGGYKDWCNDKLHIPAFTVEVGNDRFPHPLSFSILPEIYAQNKEVLPAVFAALDG